MRIGEGRDTEENRKAKDFEEKNLVLLCCTPETNTK